MESVNPYAAPRTEAGVGPPIEPPKSFGQVLLAGTHLYLRRFPAVAAIMLVVWGPLEILQSYLEYYVIDTEDLGTVFRISTMLDSLFGIIASAAVVQLEARELRGETCPWWTCLSLGLRAWPRLFATRFVSGFLLVLAALLLIVPALYFAVRFSLAETVSVIEYKVGTGATNRSLELTRGRFWWYFALGFVTIGPLLTLGVVSQLPLVFVPQIDNWISSAACTWLVDLASPWVMLVYVAALASTATKEHLELDEQKGVHTTDLASRPLA